MAYVQYFRFDFIGSSSSDITNWSAIGDAITAGVKEAVGGGTWSYFSDIDMIEEEDHLNEDKNSDWEVVSVVFYQLGMPLEFTENLANQVREGALSGLATYLNANPGQKAYNYGPLGRLWWMPLHGAEEWEYIPSGAPFIATGSSVSDKDLSNRVGFRFYGHEGSNISHWWGLANRFQTLAKKAGFDTSVDVANKRSATALSSGWRELHFTVATDITPNARDYTTLLECFLTAMAEVMQEEENQRFYLDTPVAKGIERRRGKYIPDPSSVLVGASISA